MLNAPARAADNKAMLPVVILALFPILYPFDPRMAFGALVLAIVLLVRKRLRPY